MDTSCKEKRFEGVQPSPWRVTSLPKFTDVPGRKFNGSCKAKTNDSDPATPPSSPMGAFKYPALLRQSNAWLNKTTSVDAIVRELRKSSNCKGDGPSANDSGCPEEKKKTSGEAIKLEVPAISSRRPQPDLMDCSEHGRGRLPEKIFNRKISTVSVQKKSERSPEAGDTKEDTGSGNVRVVDQERNRFGMISPQDFDVILRHALSHDPVMSRYNSTPGMRRSMIFEEKSGKRSQQNKFFDKNDDCNNRRKSLWT